MEDGQHLYTKPNPPLPPVMRCRRTNEIVEARSDRQNQHYKKNVPESGLSLPGCLSSFRLRQHSDRWRQRQTCVRATAN